MFYHLFDWLKQKFDLHGVGIFQYITFRASMSIIVSLLITTIYGKKIILYLSRKQIGESVRDLGLAGEQQKKGTPTMGGVIILLGILIPTLLFTNLNNLYIQLMLLCTVWLGAIGFLDDYLKLAAKKNAQKNGTHYQKKDKDGLAGTTKLIGQIGLGIIIGATLYFNQNVGVQREIYGNIQTKTGTVALHTGEKILGITEKNYDGKVHRFAKVKTPITTIPFVKNHEFNYSRLIGWIRHGAEKYTWIVYILVVTFIITAVSNGANLTDGLDGLAAGTSAIIAAGLGIFIYLSGNYKFAEYLNIMYIPNTSELSIFIAAVVGSCVGFLWYNIYPAQIFMGDTGSLALGGIIAAIAIIIRKELLLPLLCFIFLIENMSVILQVSYFKYTKHKYGVGKRLLLMSPLHHHYQKKGYHENKIAIRFWIITVLCVILCIATLKMR